MKIQKEIVLPDPGQSFKLFKPQTWSLQKWRMSNGIHEIIISGKLGPGKWNKTRSGVSLSGIAELKEGSNLLALICAFYFVECNLESQDDRT